jgi:hypothetical protein
VTRPPRTCEAPRCRRHLPPGRRRFCSDLCRVRGQRAERRLDPGEFGRAVIRMIRAMSGRADASDLAEFALFWEIRAEADRATFDAITALKAAGYSWADLAEEVGGFRQAMSQWHKRKAAQYGVNTPLTPASPAGQPAYDRVAEPSRHGGATP